jgi:hypothetical protein
MSRVKSEEAEAETKDKEIIEDMGDAKFLLLIFLVTSAALSACRGQKEVGNSTEVEESIIISQGGGFTGAYDYFQLLSDGSVFRLDETGKQLQLQGKLTEAQSTYYFDEMKEYSRNEKPFQNPGNMSKSLTLESESESFVYVWDAGSEDVPEKLKGIFNDLWEEIQGLNSEN